MLVGFLFLTPSVGVVANASASIPWGTFSDYGVDDEFVQGLDTKMPPGSSAVIVLVSSATPDTVTREVSRFGGTVLRTGLGRRSSA